MPSIAKLMLNQWSFKSCIASCPHAIRHSWFGNFKVRLGWSRGITIANHTFDATLLLLSVNATDTSKEANASLYLLVVSAKRRSVRSLFWIVVTSRVNEIPVKDDSISVWYRNGCGGNCSQKHGITISCKIKSSLFKLKKKVSRQIWPSVEFSHTGVALRGMYLIQVRHPEESITCMCHTQRNLSHVGVTLKEYITCRCGTQKNISHVGV